MDNYNYPMGADTSLAPWNQEDLPEREVEVTISVTLSKTVKVLVDDYKIEDDGRYIAYDFSECDLNKAVEDQVTLPQDLAVFTERMFDMDLNLKAAGMSRGFKDAIKDCKDWNVDEMEIVLE